MCISTHCFLSYSFKIVMRCISYIPFLHCSPFFLFLKIYQLENLVLGLTVPHNLYSIDCRLLTQFSMFLCSLDIDTWVRRFEKTFGKTVLFVTSAKLDTQCLDPVIYCGLENILILPFLLFITWNIFCKRDVPPHL